MPNTLKYGGLLRCTLGPLEAKGLRFDPGSNEFRLLHELIGYRNWLGHFASQVMSRNEVAEKHNDIVRGARNANIAVQKILLMMFRHDREFALTLIEFDSSLNAA